MLLLTPTTTLLLLTLLLLLLLLLPLRRWPAIQARLCSAGGFKRDAEYPPVGNYHFNAYQSLIEKVDFAVPYDTYSGEMDVRGGGRLPPANRVSSRG